MKRQPTEWQKISANHVCDKGLVSRMYIKKSCNSIVRRQKTQLKMGKGSEVSSPKKINKWRIST